MSTWTKFIVAAGVFAAGTYFFDAKTAEQVEYDAAVIKLETDYRCQTNHETMCKYYAVVQVEEEENVKKSFQIPTPYYHQKMLIAGESTLGVVVKQRKVLGPRILELTADTIEEMSQYPFE